MAMGLTSSRPLIEYTLHTPDEVWMESSGRVRGVQMEDESVEGRMIGRVIASHGDVRKVAVQCVRSTWLNRASMWLRTNWWARAWVCSWACAMHCSACQRGTASRARERHCIACQRERHSPVDGCRVLDHAPNTINRVCREPDHFPSLQPLNHSSNNTLGVITGHVVVPRQHNR